MDDSAPHIAYIASYLSSEKDKAAFLQLVADQYFTCGYVAFDTLIDLNEPSHLLAGSGMLRAAIRIWLTDLLPSYRFAFKAFQEILQVGTTNISLAHPALPMP